VGRKTLTQSVNQSSHKVMHISTRCRLNGT